MFERLYAYFFESIFFVVVGSCAECLHSRLVTTSLSPSPSYSYSYMFFGEAGLSHSVGWGKKEGAGAGQTQRGWAKSKTHIVSPRPRPHSSLVSRFRLDSLGPWGLSQKYLSSATTGQTPQHIATHNTRCDITLRHTTSGHTTPLQALRSWFSTHT